MPEFTKFVISKIRGTDDTTVILSDYKYWAEREQDLDQWCRDHGVNRRGMSIDMDGDTLVLFYLRWS